MAEDVNIPEVFLFRTGVQVTSKSKAGERAIGERGILMIGDVPYYTIERRGGYVTLPEGVFECTMENHVKKKRRLFRVKDHGEYGHNVLNSRGAFAGILIHSSNYPHNVTGCIAPGRIQITNGVDRSTEAMEDLFVFCGGFGEGKKMRIHVSRL